MFILHALKAAKPLAQWMPVHTSTAAEPAFHLLTQPAATGPPLRVRCCKIHFRLSTHWQPLSFQQRIISVDSNTAHLYNAFAFSEGVFFSARRTKSVKICVISVISGKGLSGPQKRKRLRFLEGAL